MPPLISVLVVMLTVGISHAASAQERVGPSFDCGKATHPLALTICADADLSRIDLMYVQAYQALRYQNGEAAYPELRDEALNFTDDVLQQCRIPDNRQSTSRLGH